MKVILKHNILKELRESRAIPIEVMPVKLGISLEDYKEYETEDIEVDISLADKISGIFRRNWSVFLLDELPKEVLVKRDNRTVENKTPSLHEKTIEAVEDANYIFEFVRNLSTFSGLRIPKYDDVKDLEAEDLGFRLRKQSKISIKDQENFKDPSDAFKHWRKFVESMGIFVSQYPLNAEDRIRAFSISDHDRAIIVLNTKDTPAGRTFSLFHELCHILRRNSGICDMHYSMSSDVEVFCNKFAAAFLVPIEEANDYINSHGENTILSDIDFHSHKLASRLKVSQLVIYRRFATLGIISDSEYSEVHKRLLKTFSVRPRESKESEDGSSGGPNYYTIRKIRNGEAYSNTVLEAFNTGEITAFEASNALGVGVSNLDKYRSITA